MGIIWRYQSCQKKDKRRIRLINQPREGPLWQAKDKYADCMIDVSTVDKNMHKIMAPDEPQIGL